MDVAPVPLAPPRASPGPWASGSGSTLARALSFLVLALFGCSHDDQTKVKELDAQLMSQIGKSRKEDIAKLLGEPEARDSIGDLEVWIYRFQSASKGGITAMFKAAAVHFDELIMTFDPDGLLQKYTVILRGQKSRARKPSPQ